MKEKLAKGIQESLASGNIGNAIIFAAIALVVAAGEAIKDKKSTQSKPTSTK